MPKFSEKSHCSIKQAPVPVIVSCPQCGTETEIWSDEEETVCTVCGFRIFRGGI